MAEGKRFANEQPTMAEALEQHYKERIADLEKLNEEKDVSLKKAAMALERYDIKLKEKDVYIEELRSALVEMTVKATMGGAR